jgi:PAT family beta-lactamase induction signal transducer AmpG
LLAWLQTAVVGPFADFIGRFRWHALLLLTLIATYRISDVVLGVMAFPFYVDMGYSKDEVAAISKIYGVLMTLAGAFIGGVLALRFGVMRVLFAGAVLSAASNLLFAWLATRGHDMTGLIFVISADNLSGGIASAAFIAYLSSLTNVAYSATQYALFSSVMLLLPKFVAGVGSRDETLPQFACQRGAGKLARAADNAYILGKTATKVKECAVAADFRPERQRPSPTKAHESCRIRRMPASSGSSSPS